MNSTARRFSSRHVPVGPRLLWTAATVAATMAVAGCHKDPDKTLSGMYPSAEACAADNIFTPAFCAAEYQVAAQEDAAQAPTYTDQADCKKDWQDNSCPPQSQPNGGVVYAPHMAGYWVGVTQFEGDAKQSKPFAYPLYKGTGGNLQIPITGQSLKGSSFGKVDGEPDYDAAADYTSATRPAVSRGSSFAEEGYSRGGFGDSAEGFGFGSGE